MCFVLNLETFANTIFAGACRWPYHGSNMFLSISHLFGRILMVLSALGAFLLFVNGFDW